MNGNFPTIESELSVIPPSVLTGSLVAGFLADIMPDRYILGASQIFLAVSLTVDHTWQAFLYGAVLGAGSYNSTFFIILPAISATAALLALPPLKKDCLS